MRSSVVHCADRTARGSSILRGGGLASLLVGSILLGSSAVAATTPPVLVLDASSPWSEGETLDILELVDPARSTPATLGAFGRLRSGHDPLDGTLGRGGVDLSWRPDRSLSVAMVAGGAMDAIDGHRIGSGIGPGVASIEPWPSDRISSLEGRSTAFDGLEFGGSSATAVNPFDSNRVLADTDSNDRLQSTFVATRALMRPSDGTSIGFVATHGGGADSNCSVVGVDLGQEIGSHRIDVWFQQSLGAREAEGADGDRTALGASLAGSIESVRYSLGWRRIGTEFKSGLGSSGQTGTSTISGRFNWSVPLAGISLLERVEVGVAAEVDTDSELEPSHVGIELDAVRLVTTGGHHVEVGMVHELRSDGSEESELTSFDRYRVALVSNPSSPIRLRGEVDLGESSSPASAVWNGSARWTPGGGFHLGGAVRAESRTDDLELRETLKTSINGGFGVGKNVVFRSSLGLDSFSDRLSLGHSLDLSLNTNAAISVSIEQQLPMVSSPTETVMTRARIGGKFTF